MFGFSARGPRTGRPATTKRAAPAVRAQKRAGTGPASRGRRRRNGRRVAAVASAILLAVAIGLVLSLAPGWGRGPDGFRIARIDVRGNEVLTVGEVEALSELEPGGSLLSVSVPAVEEALGGSPRIERVQASRLLPDRVLIRLVEKLPMALVETSSGVVEVADDLTVLPGVERTAFVDLPLVTGTGGELEHGSVVDREDLVTALELIRSAREISPSLWMDMSEVRIAPGSGLIIYTVADGAQIRVGSGALDADGLRRLSLVLEDLRAKGAAAESIDLRFEGQAVVKLAADAAGGRI